MLATSAMAGGGTIMVICSRLVAAGRGTGLTGKAGTAAKYARPELFGLGLLMSWVYCMWFTDAVLFDQAVQNNPSWLVSIAACLAVIVVGSRLMGVVRFCRMAVCVPCAAGTTLATGLLVASNYQLDFFLAGSVTTGLFSGVLWIAVSERCGKLMSEGAQTMAFSTAIAIPLCLTASFALPRPASAAFVALLPLAVAFCVTRPGSGRSEEASGLERQSSQGDPTRRAVAVKVCLAVGALCAISSFAWNSSALPLDAPDGLVLFSGAMLGSAFNIAVSAPVGAKKGQPDMAKVFKWISLLLVVALLLLLAPDRVAAICSRILSISICMCLDFMVLLYLSRLVSRRVIAPEKALCYSEGLVQAGILLGSLGGLASLREDAFFYANCAFVVAVACIMAFIVEKDQSLARMMMPEAEREAFEFLQQSYELSAREKEVLILLAQGRTVPYIGERLFIAPSTVESHKKRIYRKLDVHSKQDLMDLVEKAKTGTM